MQISKTANQTAARRKKPRRFSFRHWWKKSRPLTFVLLCVIAAVMLIPIVFTFLYSFFPKSEISDYLNQRSSYDVSKWLPVLFSPSQVSLRQYYKILIEQPQYLKLFLNSVKYSVGILLGQAVIIPMTAYGLSRFRFKGRDALFFLVLVLMLLFFLQFYYVKPLSRMSEALKSHSGMNRKYTLEFEGDDQLKQINEGIRELTEENDQLRRRITVLKSKTE